MKRFISSVLCVSIFFIGLDSLIEKAGAKFKSDERALALIQAARAAIGGDNSIAGVQSLRIVGQTTQTFKVDGIDRTEQGETEIALQLPDKMMKMIKLGKPDANGPGEQIVSKTVEVVVVGDEKDQNGAGAGSGSGEGVKKIVIHSGDGQVEELPGGDGVKEVNTPDGKKIIVRKVESGDNATWKTEDGDGNRIFINKEAIEADHAAMRQNELLRTTLALLLTAPQGMDVNYTYGGESDVDGTACNLVVADFGGSSIKLFLNRDSNLPVMMAYTGEQMPKMIRFKRRESPTAEVPKSADESRAIVTFKRNESGPGDTSDFQVRFSDYRSVNGLQFPYRWTTSVNGSVEETLDVTNYEVNPPNIAEKFQNQKVMVRTKKPDSQ